MSDATFIDTDGKVKVRVSGMSGGSIPDGSITAAKLAVDSVLTPSIGGGQVTNSKIADGAVTSAKIATGTIATADIAALAITNGLIADSAVTNTKLSNSSVTLTKLGSDATAALNGKLTAVKVAFQPDSDAGDIATLKTEYNALLAAMRTAGVMATS